MDKSSDLRDAIADYLLDTVKNGERVVTEEGEQRRPVSAAMLNVARQFVRDFPPVTQPTQGAPAGVLKEHLAKLPFTSQVN